MSFQKYICPILERGDIEKWSTTKSAKIKALMEKPPQQ